MSNTVIQLKYSTSTGNTPTTLAFGELAINLSDGKLFYKNSDEEIDFIENFQGPAGLDREVQFNDSGELGSDDTFTYDKSNNVLSVVTVRANNSLDLTSSSLTTSSTNETALFSFNSTIYGSGKFVVQATDGSKRQVSEILVLHDGESAYATEYAVIRTNGNLFNLDVSVISSNVVLKTTSTSSNSTVYKVSSNLLLL
jgi:hypothetical protein